MSPWLTVTDSLFTKTCHHANVVTRSGSFFVMGRKMIRLFTRYASIGVINTLIHWIIFGVLYHFGFQQSVSNFIAFCVAVTFSFFANAKWTFNAQATTAKYLLYTVFMGAMALAVGWGADNAHLNPIITLILFSAVSLFCGFAYPKLFVFRENK